MLLNRTVAPTVYPVSLLEAREQLRVSDTSEDAYIQSLIYAATEMVEQMVGRPIASQTWAMEINGASGKVHLPKAPVISVSSIAYYDRDNASQTATVSDFYLFKDEDRAWLEPKPNISWPETYDRADALTITFVAGYAAQPANLKHAVLLLVSNFFENRTPVSEIDMKEVPFSLRSLIGISRLGWVQA